MNSQFTLVPTSRNSLQNSLEQGRTASSVRESITGCLQNKPQQCSLQNFEPTEFDFYDYTNNGIAINSYYGNDGIIVHV